MAQNGVFDYAYDPSSPEFAAVHEYDIAAATVIKKGQVLKLVNSLIVNHGAVAATAIVIGIAAEDHTGVADTQNPRQSGTRIKVWDSPTAVFKSRPNVILTNTGASATTFTDATTIAAATAANKFLGGYLKIKSAVALAANNIYRLTASATGGVLTGAFTGGLVTGDTALLFPPILGNDWNYTANYDNIDLNSTGGTALQVVDCDYQQEWVYSKFRQHQKAVSAV